MDAPVENKPASKPALCSVAETAIQLCCSEKAVRTWMLRRQIPFVKVMGGSIKIKQTDIDRIIEHGSYKVGTPDTGKQRLAPWAADRLRQRKGAA